MTFRTPLLLGLTAAVALTGAVAAQPPPEVAQAFGNTIVSTYPDGRMARLWLEPDGGYAAMGRRGDRSAGHWKLKGDKLCLKQSRPIAVWFSYCTPLPSGRTWTAKAVTGEPIVVRLVKGKSGSAPA
jgi:hypothetical protein